MKTPSQKCSALTIRNRIHSKNKKRSGVIIAVFLLSVLTSNGQTSHVVPSFDAGSATGFSAGQASSSKNITPLLRVSDKDRGQLLTWSILSPPTIGTVVGFPAFALSGGDAISSDSALFYLPTPGQIGTDEFKIKISDGISSSIITVNVSLIFMEPPGDPDDPSVIALPIATNDVSFVQQSDSISVPFGTSYADLILPSGAGITYTNGMGEYLPVSWYPSNFNGHVSGKYLILGDLLLTAGNTNNTYKKAQLTIVVLPNLQPTEIILSDSVLGPYPFADPGFPPNVFTTNDTDDDVHTYHLVDGPGDSDNCKFSVRNDLLLLKGDANPDKQTKFSIRVRSTDSNKNFIERIFLIYIIPKGKASEKTVDVPNAFSPNGDGINDVWIVPELKEYKNVDIKVFDRSGALMFHSINPTQGWDGRNPNGKVIAGAYYYMIRVDEINLKKQGVLIVLTH